MSKLHVKLIIYLKLLNIRRNGQRDDVSVSVGVWRSNRLSLQKGRALKSFNCRCVRFVRNLYTIAAFHIDIWFLGGVNWPKHVEWFHSVYVRLQETSSRYTAVLRALLSWCSSILSDLHISAIRRHAKPEFTFLSSKKAKWCFVGEMRSQKITFFCNICKIREV